MRRPRAPQFTLPTLIVALATSLSVLAVNPLPVFAWTANTFSSADENLMVQLTNQARASAGLRALTVDLTLRDYARWRSKDMIDRNYFSHTILGTSDTIFTVFKRDGYCYKSAGENIGSNTYPDDVATQTMFNGFMNSSSHRANILGAAWDHIGVGAYKGSSGNHMWTMLFVQKCSSGTGSTPRPKTPPRGATPAPTPEPTAAPTPTPDPCFAVDAWYQASLPRAFGLAFGGCSQPVLPVVGPPPTPAPTPEPSPTPTPTPDNVGTIDGSLQVTDSADPLGFVDTIVGDVTGFYFRN